MGWRYIHPKGYRGVTLQLSIQSFSQACSKMMPYFSTFSTVHKNKENPQTR